MIPRDIKVAFDGSHCPPRVFAYSYWTVIGDNMTFVVSVEGDGDVSPELISEGRQSNPLTSFGLYSHFPSQNISLPLMR